MPLPASNVIVGARPPLRAQPDGAASFLIADPNSLLVFEPVATDPPFVFHLTSIFTIHSMDISQQV
jgi:hypothetical protein